MKKYIFPAFTLVELIVVITIVGILSTVGFVSYSGYLSGARDSNRYSQLTKLSDSLQTYAASKSLPLPDDYIEIQASGSLVAYQGYVGVDVLETIDYTNGGLDPKDDTYYTYYLTKDRRSLQLMAMMEEQSVTAFNLTSKTNAINYEDRYPKVYGRKLGVLTYADDSNIELINTPAQEITANVGGLDIVNTTTIYTGHISNLQSEKITGTGASIRAINPLASCRRIKQTGGSNGDGIYNISFAGNKLEVYCDMQDEGGGWTLVAEIEPTNANHRRTSEFTPENLSDTGVFGGKYSDILINTIPKFIGYKLECFDEKFVSYTPNCIFIGNANGPGCPAINSGNLGISSDSNISKPTGVIVYAKDARNGCANRDSWGGKGRLWIK